MAVSFPGGDIWHAGTSAPPPPPLISRCCCCPGWGCPWKAFEHFCGCQVLSRQPGVSWPKFAGSVWASGFWTRLSFRSWVPGKASGLFPAGLWVSRSACPTASRLELAGYHHSCSHQADANSRRCLRHLQIPPAQPFEGSGIKRLPSSVEPLRSDKGDCGRQITAKLTLWGCQAAACHVRF